MELLSTVRSNTCTMLIIKTLEKRYSKLTEKTSIVAFPHVFLDILSKSLVEWLKERNSLTSRYQVVSELLFKTKIRRCSNAFTVEFEQVFLNRAVDNLKFKLLILLLPCIQLNPAHNNMLKVNNRNSRKRCEICSKLTIKTPERHQWRRSGVFIATFEHISHLFLVFLLLTLNR